MFGRPSVNRPPVFAICASFLLLAACSARDPAVANPPAVTPVPAASEDSGIPAAGAATIVASFDVSAEELPESIAVDGTGNIYLSMAPLGEIWKLDRSGAFQEIVATFPTAPGLFGLSGIRFDAEGNLYVANSADHEEARGVWKISPSGDMERIAGTSGIPLPNDVAIAPEGTLYITDSATGAVWRSRAGGAAEMWVQDEALEGTGAFGLPVPIGANGIVVVQGSGMFSGSGSAGASASGLVVANTEKGQVVYVPILQDGSAGQATVVAADPEFLFGLDGLAVDSRGTVYGAVNAANRVIRISGSGTDVAEVTSGEPLDFPAGLAFGDRQTLLVANFSVIHFLHDPPTLEDARPAVIAVPLGAEGESDR